MNQAMEAIKSDEFGRFEKKLKSIFTPIQPDRGFVQKLKEKLFKKTEILIEQDNPAFYLLLILIGLIVGILSYLLATKRTKD